MITPTPCEAPLGGYAFALLQKLVNPAAQGRFAKSVRATSFDETVILLEYEEGGSFALCRGGERERCVGVSHDKSSFERESLRQSSALSRYSGTDTDQPSSWLIRRRNVSEAFGSPCTT